MTVWRYVAVDVTGFRSTGEVEAENPRAVRAQLRARGLLAQSVEPAGMAGMPAFRRRVAEGELAMFSRQFATLLGAGLTIEKAIAVMAEQPEQEALRTALKRLREDVVAGHDLAGAMERQPRAFPAYFVAIVRAGEEAGAMPAVMERLAEALERGQALRHKVWLALVYPASVTMVAILVVGILLTHVVPQIVAVFEHSRQALPWLTRAMIAVSDALRGAWWALLAAALAAGSGARALLRREPLRRRWHAFLLGLPVLGRLRGAMATARLSGTLAMLVGSGVPVVAALGHAAATIDDLVYRRAVEEAAARVREGAGISRALREAGPFPPILLHLVASGEASGELPRVLAQAARQQEQLVETRLAALTALLEPVMILLMGGVVLTIVMATLEPIIEMNRLLR